MLILYFFNCYWSVVDLQNVVLVLGMQQNDSVYTHTHTHMASLVAWGKECSVEAPGDVGSIPGSGRFPGGGIGNPLQYSCLENPMNRGPERVRHSLVNKYSHVFNKRTIWFRKDKWFAQQSSCKLGYFDQPIKLLQTLVICCCEVFLSFSSEERRVRIGDL